MNRNAQKADDALVHDMEDMVGGLNRLIEGMKGFPSLEEPVRKKNNLSLENCLNYGYTDENSTCTGTAGVYDEKKSAAGEQGEKKSIDKEGA